ncbi:Arginine transport system permease protein ArtQ [Variovorax sp. SRS16]|uniref:amino acid ABC transporter permease n=1 Tax=Variovorax sp. SRS16 TaxID=282217 RepID=UPI001315FD79|nr:amino acid ABC transporter permease [Variovorax sp. SRS16]VTU34268.1 Arginine transport system permease protein ArtQ [Variovorax sp. SRS16]
MEFTWDFSAVLQNWPVLLKGIGVTAGLWAVAFPSAMLIGLVVALGALSKNRALGAATRGYMELFRNVPVLIQLVWFFYAFPIVTGWQLSPFVAALLALMLNASAYCSEIFRGGIASLPRGQWEGARAIGMQPAQVLRRVVLPQVFKRMLPAFTNRGIELAKNTSIASVIAVHELMYQGRALSAAFYRPLEILTAVAVVYFVLIYPGAYLASRIEKRLALRGN